MMEMQDNNRDALDNLVTTAELTAKFTVQVADGERVSYITGTKWDGPAPVMFTASFTERPNGTLDFRAHALSSDGAQATFATADELTEWVLTTVSRPNSNVEVSKKLLAEVAGSSELKTLLDTIREQVTKNDNCEDGAYQTSAGRRLESVMGHLQMALDAAELYRGFKPQS